MFGIRVRLTTGLGRDRRTGSGPPNGVWLWGLGSMGQPNGVWRWGLGSMRAARHGHVGRALSGGGTARRVEGASNYFVDERWCSWATASNCAERRAWSTPHVCDDFPQLCQLITKVSA